jgi:sugar (pentulose or hexulose) kinase
VRYTADQARLLLTAIEKVAGPHRRAVAAGGWTQMASVRGAKAAVIDALSFSPVVQPGATGAAMLAAYALAGADPAAPDPASRDLAGFIREGMT